MGGPGSKAGPLAFAPVDCGQPHNILGLKVLCVFNVGLGHEFFHKLLRRARARLLAQDIDCD